MRHVVFYSSGIGSWAAAKRVAEKHGTKNLVLLFTDTLIEDNDNYRFLIESACNVFQFEFNQQLKDIAENLLQAHPPVDGPELEQRKLLLWQAANEVRSYLPGLIWISKGLTPFEIFKKKRIMGSNKIAPCSAILKRECAESWVKMNCDPSDTTLYFGMDWSEIHRLEGAQRVWSPYRVEGPLVDPPFLNKSDMIKASISSGVEPPRLYSEGFVHANCGGGCVRAGVSAWKNLYKTRPQEFARWEKEEIELNKIIHPRQSFTLTRVVARGKIPLPLSQLREEIEADKQIDLFDWGGCGCFVEDVT